MQNELQKKNKENISNSYADRTIIIDSLNQIGNEITICGFVQTVRSHGKIAFLDIRDRSGIMQVGGFLPDVVSKMSALHPQDVVSIIGKVKKREEKYINHAIPTGTVEIEASNVIVIAAAEQMPFDMGGKELHLELPTLLDHRSLTLRHQTVYPIFKIQEAIADGFRQIAQKLGCVEIFVPTISASATEGGAEVFDVNYYGHAAYMTQSPQLYKQILVAVFERVFTIAHAYRAEPSVTTRHLSESIQMDCEFAFADFNQLLDLMEEVGIETLKYAEKKCKKELDFYGVDSLSFGKIPRLKLREAQEIIFKETGRDVRTEKDLSPMDEADLSAWALKTHKSDFITITHFPTKKRAFYTMPDPEDPEYSLSYDLLFRGVEILSGSQRINTYNELYKTIQERGMNPNNFLLYLEAFKYGMPPEGGFSFGLERLTMKLVELHNVREASLFPRDMERVDERFSLVSDLDA